MILTPDILECPHYGLRCGLSKPEVEQYRAEAYARPDTVFFEGLLAVRVNDGYQHENNATSQSTKFTGSHQS